MFLLKSFSREIGKLPPSQQLTYKVCIQEDSARTLVRTWASALDGSPADLEGMLEVANGAAREIARWTREIPHAKYYAMEEREAKVIPEIIERFRRISAMHRLLQDLEDDGKIAAHREVQERLLEEVHVWKRLMGIRGILTDEEIAAQEAIRDRLRAEVHRASSLAQQLARAASAEESTSDGE